LAILNDYTQKNILFKLKIKTKKNLFQLFSASYVESAKPVYDALEKENQNDVVLYIKAFQNIKRG